MKDSIINWNKIDEKNYNKLGIVNNKEVKCINSYINDTSDGRVIINFFDYSKFNEKFIDELDNYYTEINEMNELIDGSPDEEGYESSASLSSLFHGYINESKGFYYLSISKVLVEDGYNYVLQMFTKGKKGLFALEIATTSIDESNVVNSIQSRPYVKEAIRKLIEIAN